MSTRFWSAVASERRERDTALVSGGPGYLPGASGGAPGRKAPSPQTLCRRTPKATDTTALEREIDERVYRLYGLTQDEIRLVEESAR